MTAAYGMCMCDAVRKVLLVTKIGSVSQPILIIHLSWWRPNAEKIQMDFDSDVECFLCMCVSQTS